MATMITAECINCAACEAECPNTAIYQGGVEWELNGVTHPPLSEDVFYIVPEKCTECIGFHDQEACAVVCPADVCIPNPDIPETEEVLIDRARQLHPDAVFADNFPSRFNPGRAAGVAGAAAPAPEGVAPAAPAAARSAVAAGEPAERSSSPSPAVAGVRRPEKSFPNELSMSFAEAAALLKSERVGQPSFGKWIVAFAQPLLGALPIRQKRSIERAVADRRFFTAAGATGLNALQNAIVYPVVLAVFGALFLDRSVFSQQLKWLIFLGVALATVETIWRMRESFRGRPADEVVYRAALYGLPMAPLAAPLIAARVARRDTRPAVRQDGFTDPRFEDKLERDRRYGQVYRVREDVNGCIVELEFPRRIPPSGVKEELGVPDEMPDYDYDISLRDGFLVVKGKVTDANVRKVAAVSPAFPPDFTTSIKVPTRVAGFRHRLRDKTLEIALPGEL